VDNQSVPEILGYLGLWAELRVRVAPRIVQPLHACSATVGKPPWPGVRQIRMRASSFRSRRARLSLVMAFFAVTGCTAAPPDTDVKPTEANPRPAP